MDTRQIVDYAFEDDGVNFRNSLYAAIYDKVTAHIDSKKSEIAQNLINTESQNEDEVA
jgi:hypothetical protein